MLNDDNVITVGTRVDLSALRAGMQQSTQVVRTELAIQQQVMQQAATTMRTSTNVIVDAEKQAAAAVASGHTALAQSLQQAADQEREALSGTVAEHAKAAAAVNMLKEALAGAEPTHKSYIESIQGMRAAVGLAGRDIGIQIPRALESVAARLPGFETAIQAAFPLITAAAFGKVIGDVAAEVANLYDKYIRLSDVQIALGDSAQREWKIIQQSIHQANEETAKYIALTQGKPAGLNYLRKSQGTELFDPWEAMGEKARTALSDLDKSSQSKINELLKPVALKDAGDQVQRLRDEVTKLNTVIDAYSNKGGTSARGIMGGRTIEQIKAEREYIDQASGILGAVTTGYGAKQQAESEEEQQERVKRNAEVRIAQLRAQGKDSAEAERQIWRDVTTQVNQGSDLYISAIEKVGTLSQRARSEAVQKLQRDDQERLENIRLNAAAEGDSQQQIRVKLIEELETRLSKESQYSERVRAIKGELARYEEEAIRTSTEAFKRGQEESLHSLEKLSAFAEKFLGHASEADTLTLHLKIKADTEEAKDQLAENIGQLNAGSAANVGNLELQKLQVQRSYKLSGQDDIPSQVEEMRQLEQIDQKIFTERIEHAKILSEIDKVNDSKKHGEDLKQIATLQAQNNQKLAVDTTQILSLQTQKYRQFFDTINSGFKSAVDSWIKTGHGFGAALQNMWADMVSNFANTLIEMGVKWVEHEALKLVVHTASNEEQVGSDAAAATQSSGIRLTQTLKEISANAASAATGAYKSTVGIPIVGPVLAPIAAGAAYVAVEAYGALAALESGGITPSNIGPAGAVALLHGSEAVLPKPMTDMLMSAAGQGKTGNSNQVAISQTNHYNGFTDQTFKQMAEKHANHLVRVVGKGLRKANAY